MEQLIIKGDKSFMDISNTHNAIIIGMDNLDGGFLSPIIILYPQQIQQVIDYLTRALAQINN